MRSSRVRRNGASARIEQSSEDGIARRRVEIVKMRGVPFIGGYHDLTIRTWRPGGLSPAAACERPGLEGQLASGIQGLDDLLGAGLLGTVTLITGTGRHRKTTVASQTPPARHSPTVIASPPSSSTSVTLTFVARAEARACGPRRPRSGAA